ncbi:putative RING/U-box superfamily protein [Hibiscus syriacus]|uniref:RING/U-box superfamily protein n=1 Tax=Hibiscus syriacus TaxID=106335 RepID=A0A6A2Z7L2_HIBSY|nr:uncharacterized protein LOC120150648 [Hibiscus syriacus]KAE8687105.1 putative RING/U-box superfamily protein [Hibiscus syriacus]
MVRGKLILICQHGGEFVPKDDGSLSYSGGEAHALDISPETAFDDLKYKLAEKSNLEYKSLTMKYFLPGNRRTLITLSNDKDLKRMYDFHEDSVTADIFLTGTKSFVPANLGTQAKRKIGAKKGATSAAGPATSKVARSAVGLKDVTVGIATPSDSVAGVNATLRSPTKAAKRTAGRNIVDGLFEVSVADATDCSTDTIDMSASPADTVKKRRRIASWRSGANGLNIVSVDDSPDETRKSTSRKKVARRCNTVAVVDNMSLTLAPPNDASPDELVEFWKNGITGEGQDFGSVAEFRDALQKYAIAHRFGYRLRKNDTNRAYAVCAVEGCPWKLHASWVPSDGVFRVKRMDEAHTCDGEKSRKTGTPAKKIGW